METTMFVDRETELGLIENALDDLFNKDRLLRMPIINFYGVDGIGKTTILKEVIQKCKENAVSYIDGNASQGLPLSSLLQKVSDLTRKYNRFPQQLNDKDILDQFIECVRALLEQGPLIILLDAVDTTKEDHLNQLKKLLSRLDGYNNLFVVLTSRSDISYQQEKSVLRKLFSFPLKPFNLTISNLYLDTIEYTMPPNIRQQVFEWTRGYPLAMHVMVNAIKERGNFLIDEQEQKEELINFIVEEVIHQCILSEVKGDNLKRFQKILSLLAVPRKFNLPIMIKLIEYFEPDLKRQNSLAYMSLPQEIFKVTGTMSWNFAKKGFALDESLRNILLWQLKITNLQRYYEINRFLAEINRSIATEVVGSDRTYYQRDYLYHIANSTQKQNVLQIIEEAVKDIMVNTDNSFSQLLLFRKELPYDTELREVLDSYTIRMLELLDDNLAQIISDFAVYENNEEKRFGCLKDFFAHFVDTSPDFDFTIELKEKMRSYLSKEKPVIISRLHEELAQHDLLREALRKDFPILFGPFSKDTSTKG